MIEELKEEIRGKTRTQTINLLSIAGYRMASSYYKHITLKKNETVIRVDFEYDGITQKSTQMSIYKGSEVQWNGSVR